VCAQFNKQTVHVCVHMRVCECTHKAVVGAGMLTDVYNFLLIMRASAQSKLLVCCITLSMPSYAPGMLKGVWKAQANWRGQRHVKGCRGGSEKVGGLVSSLGSMLES